MRTPTLTRGFSLLEVLFAVAVFAVSVSVVLALLLPLGRLGAQNADRLTAQRLPDALQVELARLASVGLDALAVEVPVMRTPLEPGLAFVATRDGGRLHSRDYHPPASGGIAEEEHYFLVECWRFAEGALQFEAGQPSLALAVRVSWPGPGSAPSGEPQELMFTVAINR